MTDQPPTLYCANHPQVETTLRCNRCEKPICTQCAVLTPTGYRCRECVRGQQKTYETAAWFDYPLAFLLAAGLAFLGSLFIPRLSFFSLLVTPLAGGIIAEGVRMVVRKRRSRNLFILVAAGTALGASLQLLIFFFQLVVFSTAGAGVGFRSILPLIWYAAYAFLVTSTVYYRLGGIRL
jgi:hypothetical protein